MKASVQHTTGYTHAADAAGHQLTVDEPAELGGADQGPSPQALLATSLAACTAITMEMYAERKGWNVAGLEVSCEYDTPERGEATTFKMILRLPEDLEAEQVQRLRAIAARCPVHRVLEGEVRFVEEIEPLPRAEG